MIFTMYNLTTSDIRFQASDSTNKQGSLINVPNITPNNTLYVDGGVVNGCIAGIKNDVLMLPYLSNGVVAQPMSNLPAFLSNAQDKSYVFVMFTQYATSDITDLMFNGNCKVIKQLILNGSQIQNIGDNAFTGIPILSFTNYNSGMLNIGSNAFSNCSLTGAINLYNVQSIGANAFSGNFGITKITLSNKLTSLGVGAFSTCRQLASIQMPASLTVIPDEAFQGCSGLTVVDFTSGWDGVTQLKSIGANVFDSCYSLTKINCPWTTPPTLDPSAFGDLVQMSSYSYNTSGSVPFVINVPASAVNAYKQAAGWSTIANAIQGVSNANPS